MTSVLSAGRYKQKKEWSTQSIPELVSNAGDSAEDEPRSGIEIQVNGIPQQFHSTARRSSLAIGLFPGEDRKKLSQHLAMTSNNHNNNNNNNDTTGGGAAPKNSKRRSSIAVAFLGRKDNAKVMQIKTDKLTDTSQVWCEDQPRPLCLPNHN